MSKTTNTSDSLNPAKNDSSRSHLAAGANLSGNLTVPGHMELLGHVDGKITADTIVIEGSGTVVGELRAASIAIKGQFEGQIFGGHVELLSGARVSGQISYTSLAIESGAEVNSACSLRK